jgi:hypothetical protein
MHRFGMQGANARRFRDKGMTRLIKFDCTDAVAMEWGGYGQDRM